ncbi:MAG: carboxypeptidase regulatory-like domain-containing protein [bacterium]
MTVRILALSALIALAAHPLSAQRSAAPVRPAAAPDTSSRGGREYGTIDGVVSDTNLAPLRGAFVSILSTKVRVGTGPNGRFRITKVPPGQFILIVTRAGYRPNSAAIDVHASDTLRLSYTLAEVSATELAGVTVTEKAVSFRMAGFEARRRVGLGQFMTADDIDRNNTTFATELFRRFTSINVSPSRTSSLTEWFALSSREGANPQLGACPMTVYIDQIPMPTPFNLDLLPSPKEFGGIEVYAGSATVPPQFNGPNRGCGVILIWTKDGY